MALVAAVVFLSVPYVEGERINADTVRGMWTRGKFLLGEHEGTLTAFTPANLVTGAAKVVQETLAALSESRSDGALEKAAAAS